MRFKRLEGQAFDGLVIVYDVAGFSAFFNLPDIYGHVPGYLNQVTEAVQILLDLKQPYWGPPLVGKAEYGARVPVHRKFLGDGELLIFDLSQVADSAKFVRSLLADFWSLQAHFDAVVERIREMIPIVGIPDRIRLGVSRGHIHTLVGEDESGPEYIGIAINLASRLSVYCKDLGALIAARVGPHPPPPEGRVSLRVVAKDIKGCPEEFIWVDRADYEGLDPDIRTRLFAEL